MPHYMRIFSIFYLSLATYFTGTALGRLAALKDELEKIRRYHAFERREVNKHMMHYLASTDDPTKVDQYEYCLASLMNLGKVDSGDIRPIMDKFRSLAKHGGHTGYIQVDHVPDESDTTVRESGSEDITLSDSTEVDATKTSVDYERQSSAEPSEDEPTTL